MLCLYQWVPLSLQGLSAQARPPLNKARRAAGTRCNASKLPRHAICQRLQWHKAVAPALLHQAPVSLQGDPSNPQDQSKADVWTI